MFSLRLIGYTLLIMFAFPALGLMGFQGNILDGLVASVLSVIVTGVVLLVLLCLPGLANFLEGMMLLGSYAGGSHGVRVVQLSILTAMNTGTLFLVAWMLDSVSLVGRWPTVGAAVILALLQLYLRPRRSDSNSAGFRFV